MRRTVRVTVKGKSMFSKFTLMAAVVAFALGLGAGWVVFADAATPCWEVQAALQDARDDAVASFGEEGYDVMRQAAAEAATRPDCFSPEERESLRQMAESPQQPPPGDGGEVTVEPTESGTADD
jgi:hypothetical protein